MNIRFSTLRTMAFGLGAVLVAMSTAHGSPPSRTPLPQGSYPVAGPRAYEQWCLGCHGPMPGVGMFPPAGTYTLEQRYQGRLPAVLAERSDLNEALIRLVVRQGIGNMPPTRKTEVTEEDLRAIVAFLMQPKSGQSSGHQP